MQRIPMLGETKCFDGPICKETPVIYQQPSFKVEYRNNRMYYIFNSSEECVQFYNRVRKSVICSIVRFCDNTGSVIEF